MKKFIFFAAAAVIALASCTKNEADKTAYEQAKVINFNTVAGKATKTPLSGAVYKTTDPHFGVYSFALPTNGQTWAANSATSGLYMDKVEISYNSTDLIWEPASTYFWPLSGTLTFTGFSPISEASKVSYNTTEKKLIVTNYVAAAATANQTDLMWAETQKNLSDNQSTYTDENSNTSTLRGVNMVFHHALSQVIFKVKKAAGLDDYTVTVNSIIFNAMSTGTLTVTDDTPEWGTATTKANYTSEGSDVIAPNNSAAFAVFGNANMMVPQTLTAEGSENDQKFDITYSLEKSGVNLGQKTVTIALKTDAVEAWVQNKIYNYNIVIDLNKIYFNPTMVEWDDANPQPTQITVQS